jgi:selenocysteine-specific elongation factor
VAVNLAGVDHSQARRGMVLAQPGTFQPTTLIDARLRHLPDTGMPLKHNTEVKLFTGAAEVVGHVRLLGSLAGQALAPGVSGWVQLALTAPVVVGKGDRFILRRPSPGDTLGGGEVIDPHPKRRHRRHDLAVIDRLETLARGTAGEILTQALDALGPASVREALDRAGLERAVGAEAVAEARQAGMLVELDGEQLAASRAVWGRIESALTAALSNYHAAHPLRTGMAREELKSRLSQGLDPHWRPRLTSRAFNAVIAYATGTGLLATSGSLVRLARHAVIFTPAQQKTIDTLLADLRRDPYNTPSYKDVLARVGDELLAALIEQGLLVAVSADVLFDADTYRQMVDLLRAHLQSHGKVAVAEVRDLFTTSRKYALALMEHLDAIGVTRRVGDERVLKNA